MNSTEMTDLLFALFFNLSFDLNFRMQMINAGLINILILHIKSKH